MGQENKLQSQEHSVKLNIAEIFEIVGLLKEEIKANGGTDDTDSDIVSAYNKLGNFIIDED